MSGLPLVPNLLLCTVTIVLGVWVGRRAHRREPISDASHVLKHSPHLWLVPALPLALLAYHLVFYWRPEWEWLLPYPVQYYYGPAAWGLVIGCFTYFAAFGTAVALETRHPQRRQLMIALSLSLIAVQQFHWQTTGKAEVAVREPKTSPEGHVFQTSEATCVPAATASLLRLLGDPRDEHELVNLMGTDEDGTLPSQMVMAMRRLGYREFTMSVDRDGLAKLVVPAVVFLRDNVHAVTLLQHNAAGGVIWDPGRGRFTLPADRFKQLMTGAHVIHFVRESPSEERGSPVNARGF